MKSVSFKGVGKIREKTGKEELSSDDVQKAVHDVIRRLNRILPNYKTIRRVQIRREKLARNGTQKVTRHKEEADPPDESFNTKETSK